MEKISDRISETAKKARAYAEEHSVKKLKAAFIGCPQCGSKLRREHLRSDFCPLCHTDLCSNTTLERLKRFRTVEEELREKLKQEQIKQKKLASVKWLVKFEYHC